MAKVQKAETQPKLNKTCKLKSLHWGKKYDKFLFLTWPESL